MQTPAIGIVAYNGTLAAHSGLVHQHISYNCNYRAVLLISIIKLELDKIVMRCVKSVVFKHQRKK